MTQYVYEGAYTEFRGYAFVNGKPTTVSDRATQDALAKRHDFKVYEPPAPPAPAVFRRPTLRLKKGDAQI